MIAIALDHPNMKQALARIALLAVVAWTIMSFLFLGLILYLYAFGAIRP
jgi:hypothetical protein